MRPYQIFIVLGIFLLVFYFFGGFVFIFASLIVLFEKTIFGRINFIPGIEFTTLATLLVTLKYGLIIGLLFVIFIPLALPLIINFILEEKWVVNPNFQFLSIGLGNIVDIVSVILIFYLRSLDIIWITLIVLIFKHSTNLIADKLRGVTFSLNEIGVPIGFLFNLSIIYFLHPFWMYLLS